MDEDIRYEELIEAAIERQIEILGRGQAVEQARTVDRLTVDDDGTVLEVEGDGKEILSAVVDAYKAIAGDLPASLIAYRIRDEFDISQADLPANVVRHL